MPFRIAYKNFPWISPHPALAAMRLLTFLIWSISNSNDVTCATTT